MSMTTDVAMQEVRAAAVDHDEEGIGASKETDVRRRGDTVTSDEHPRGDGGSESHCRYR